MGKILTSAAYAEQEADVAPGELTDDMAVTIASWWHSPGSIGSILARVSHGLPFQSGDLVEDIDATFREAEQGARPPERQTTPEDLDQLRALRKWASELWILSVWSSYGHRFLSDDGDEVCLTCGARYRVEHDDPDDYHHGRYVTWNGDDPTECPGTSRAHGQDDMHNLDHHRDGGTCAMCDHDCNCLACTG